MADIQFQEPQYARPLPGADRRSWLTSLVIRTGLAKDDAGAQKILLIIFVLASAAAILVFALSGGGNTKLPVPSIDGTYPQEP